MADEVDARVRERLAFLGLDLVGRLGGRRSLPEVWLRSLTSLDPWLPESTDAVKATALASEIADWVRGALAGVGVVTVQLRVVEPAGRGDRWMIEPLVTDVDESSLVLPLSDALGAGSPFPAANA
ncbi:MAG: hypothetical protein V9E89_02275 [Ilumatobacteraceae bacterium]